MIGRFTTLLHDYPLPAHFPHRRRIVWFTLLLALSFGQRASNFSFDDRDNSGDGMWDVLRHWIRFQIRFHPKRFFLVSPLIRAVAGGYASDQTNFVSHVPLNKSEDEFIRAVTSNIVKYFFGLRQGFVRAWLENQIRLIRKVEMMTGLSFLGPSQSLVEIGPGVGGLLTLATYSGTQRIVSVDVPEMHVLQETFLEASSVEQLQVRMIDSSITNLARRVLVELEDVDVPTFNVVAMYSFTELPIEQRVRFEEVFSKASAILLVCNQHFGGVDNFAFIEEMSARLGKTSMWISIKEVFGNAIPNYIHKHRIYVLSSSKGTTGLFASNVASSMMVEEVDGAIEVENYD